MIEYRLTARIGCLILCVVVAVSCAGESIDKSETLNRGLNVDPESLDPHQFSSTQAATVLYDTREGLLNRSPNGDLIGGVADDWSVSENGLVYTFRIRSNARWSNGAPVSGRDFSLTLKRLVDPKNASAKPEFLEVIGNATDILEGRLAPSELQVSSNETTHLEIRLESPTPYFPQLLANPIAFPIYFSGRATNSERGLLRADLDVFNGAYTVEKRVMNSSIELRRNEHYWNDEDTAVDRVVYHIVDQRSEASRYKAGELQVTDNVSSSAFREFSDRQSEELRVAPLLGVYYYAFNLRNPKFADNKNLRLALSLSIDRKQIVESVTGRGELPAYGFVPPGVSNYEGTTLEILEFSPERRHALARQYLEAADISDAENLELELRYNAGGGHREIAVAVQAMWRDVLGIDAKLIGEEFKVFLSNIQNFEGTEIYRLSWRGDFNDPATFLQLFRSSNSSNLSGYSNSRVDELLAASAVQMNMKTRQSALQQVEEIVLQDHPVIPLYFYVSKHLVAPNVRGWRENILDIHYSRELSLTEK